MAKNLLDSAGLQLYDSLIKGVAGGSLTLSEDGTKLVLKSVDGTVLSEVDAPSGGSSGGGSGDAIPRTGNRGVLSGHEESTFCADLNAFAYDLTVNESSPDTAFVFYPSSITIEDGTVFTEEAMAAGENGTSWTKVVYVFANMGTVTLGSSWMWSNGVVPTIGSGALVLHWNTMFGIASFISME